MDNFSLTNFVEKPTRTAHRIRNRENKKRSHAHDNSPSKTYSSTLIDVVLHNGDYIIDSDVIGCPFSDHKFVVSTLKFPSLKPQVQQFKSRCLSESNLKKIEDLLLNSSDSFLDIDSATGPDAKLKYLQSTLLKLVDKVCPEKVVKRRSTYEQPPWIDHELNMAKNERDYLYKIADKSNDNKEKWDEYRAARTKFQSLNRSKMVAYFKSKGVKDFKNSKKFWQFYKSSIKLRSDVSSDDCPSTMKNGDESASTPDDITTLFNTFFTTIESVSLTSPDECSEFINNTFNELKRSNKIKPTEQTFSFKPVTATRVNYFISALSETRSSGISGISTKILKLAPSSMSPLFAKVINSCFETNTVPLEWKAAIVTPLFKKGINTEVSNYRGISVLAPLAKVFEKIVNEQVLDYLDRHSILFNGQHGFRKGHSCETALQELLSDINAARDKRLITMLLMIDYRKAFDCVDSNLLLLKLFQYGFSNNALDLIASYFKDRQQQTKLNGRISSPSPIKFGVPQGSVLGPLFFLIFINDLAFLLDNLSSKLFADDTTIYKSGPELNALLTAFQQHIKPLFSWCKFNRLDINWTKTYAMFVTNKRVLLPKELIIEGIKVQVVSEFKLLGVIIDDKLSFIKHVANICRLVNIKLFSIKRLFYLSSIVKNQFFKTFILPYYDYCLSLIMYFPKNLIQKLSNSFYICLFKLFNYKFCDQNPIIINDLLKKFNLFAFEHRVFSKLLSFANNIYSNCNSPATLHNCFRTSAARHKTRTLRNSKELDTSRSNTHYGDMTFSNFFPKLINLGCPNYIHYSANEFKAKLKTDLDSIFNRFSVATDKEPIKYNIFKKFFLISPRLPFIK